MSKLKKALEKAKQTRGDQPPENPAEGSPEPSGFRIDSPPASTLDQAADRPEKPQPAVTGWPAQGEKVKPTYTQTRIVEVDRSHLRQYKIVTLFDHNQTTDRITVLRSQVMEKMKDMGGNSLLITSANPGEGKSLIAANLAISVAQEVGRTTLLVDADLRDPSIQEIFGLDVKVGLTDYLLGEADLGELFINPGIDKLTILPAGKVFPDSADLLAGPSMDSLIRELKSRYKDRFIIFDTTSLLTRADPIVFSRLIDGIILIVEAERTTTKQLKRALDLLKGKPIIGTMLNKARTIEL